MRRGDTLYGVTMAVLCVACQGLSDEIDVTTVVQTNNGVITTLVSAHVVTNRTPPAVKTPTHRQLAPSMALRMITECASGLQVTDSVFWSSESVECTVTPANAHSADDLLISATARMREYGWQCRAVTNPATGAVIIQAAEGGRFRETDNQRVRRTSKRTVP